MFETFRHSQFKINQSAKATLLRDLSVLINLEELLAKSVFDLLVEAKEEILYDYNEASHLFPFWQNYPPEERGRQPKGDQYPWIEVGEHAVGRKLARLLATRFEVRDTAIPTGPDERFIVSSDEIAVTLGGLTRSAWLFSDIKSVGPRDDAPHAVMSHNQISGDGLWVDEASGVRNTILTASGPRASHAFHCTIPPLYVLSNGLIAPVVQVVVKPIYRMLSLTPELEQSGQPIKEIAVITIPNGLLLAYGPAYLRAHPGLFFPGKDDKAKDLRKLRARVDFQILKKIAPWRVQLIDFSE